MYKLICTNCGQEALRIKMLNAEPEIFQKTNIIGKEFTIGEVVHCQNCRFPVEQRSNRRRWIPIY